MGMPEKNNSFKGIANDAAQIYTFFLGNRFQYVLYHDYQRYAPDKN